MQTTEEDLKVQAFHLAFGFPKEVNHITLSDLMDKVCLFPMLSFICFLFPKVLRDFCINPEQVHYFMHDSASYMEPAAKRMRADKGYKNLVSLPCWAHILNKIGEVLMDGNNLVELGEYLRLTRLLFARFVIPYPLRSEAIST